MLKPVDFQTVCAFFFVFVLAIRPAIAKDMMEAPKNHLHPVAFSSLEGWRKDQKKKAFAAFTESCQQMKRDNRAFSKNPLYGGSVKDWKLVCDAAQTLGLKASPAAISQFFETYFSALRVADTKNPAGLFTGYYEPEVQGSFTKSKSFAVPIYGKPADLVRFDETTRKKTGLSYGRIVNSFPMEYYTRKQIENGALANRDLEILWLNSPTDAFFMQIQGSGRVRLPDGTFVRLTYAAKSGLPYTSVGAELVKAGEIEKENVSMQSISNWMEKHPTKAIALRQKNKSFVFFKLLNGHASSSGPVGAQNVTLTPQVSLAVDRRFWPFGMPVWLDTSVPGESGKPNLRWQRLLIAQDTGSAIRGLARGDVFWGAGDRAVWTAGHMKSKGIMTVLLPRPLAEKILAQ